jgi:hypothetical protein
VFLRASARSRTEEISTRLSLNWMAANAPKDAVQRFLKGQENPGLNGPRRQSKPPRREADPRESQEGWSKLKMLFGGMPHG